MSQRIDLVFLLLLLLLLTGRRFRCACGGKLFQPSSAWATASGGNRAVMAAYWFISATDASSRVRMFCRCLMRSSTWRRSLPSIARTSSSDSVSSDGGTGGKGIVYDGMPTNGNGGRTMGAGGNRGIAFVPVAVRPAGNETPAATAPTPPATPAVPATLPGTTVGRLASLPVAPPAPLLASFALLFGAGFTAAVAAVIGVRKMFNRQVGQVCCRWNQERRQAVWNM
uniref:Uncharacterized protein n=1 Tax=Anopheles coluzzii TaxID=1518534 RepID=A0A8W7PRK9_ANOCL